MPEHETAYAQLDVSHTGGYLVVTLRFADKDGNALNYSHPLRNVVISGQCDPTTDHFYGFGDEAEFKFWHSTARADDIRAALKTLDKINRKLEKYNEQFGYTSIFSDTVMRLVNAANVEQYVNSSGYLCPLTELKSDIERLLYDYKH
jgi:hypothetical protein